MKYFDDILHLTKSHIIILYTKPGPGPQLTISVYIRIITYAQQSPSVTMELKPFLTTQATKNEFLNHESQNERILQHQKPKTKRSTNHENQGNEAIISVNWKPNHAIRYQVIWILPL